MSDAAVADPRVLEGMKVQLAARDAALSAGSQPLGWKAGFGAPGALKQFELSGPLVGFMLDKSLLASGATVSLSGWKKPVAEPEIAVWFGADLADGQDREAVKAAICGMGPAIELADLDQPPVDVTAILSGNIYHRYVILGECDTGRAGARLDGITSSVNRLGADLPATDDLESNTGRVLDVVAYAASTLAACGQMLRKGDVLICGSIVPPVFLEPTDAKISHTLAPLGNVSINLTYG